MKWWLASPSLQRVLCLDDLLPSDKQSVHPVENLLSSQPYLEEFAKSPPDNVDLEHVLMMTDYLHVLATIFRLFHDNSWDKSEKILHAKAVSKYFSNWRDSLSKDQTKKRYDGFVSTEFFEMVCFTLILSFYNFFSFFKISVEDHYGQPHDLLDR